MKRKEDLIIKKISIALILSFVCCITVQAQDQLLGRVEYEKAETAFNNGNFNAALTFIEKTKEHLGSWNPKIGYLTIEILNGLADLDKYPDQHTQKLTAEVKRYMEYAAGNEADLVMDKFKVVYDIDQRIQQAKRKYDEDQMPAYRAGQQAYDNKDYQLAMREYLTAANQGNSKAMRMIGRLHGNGLGVTQDWTQALEWYHKADLAGNDEAALMIAMRYYGGEGVTKDYAKAMEWFMKAVDRGNADAMNHIGGLYAEGAGVAKDYNKTMEWYMKAADMGNTDAMVYMGGLYRDGTGVTKDYNKAMQWYRKAADKGNEGAMLNIGYFYNIGLGMTKDPAQAMQWYMKAAGKGNTGAMYNIALLYKNGESGAKDFVKAMMWFSKAADKGDATAMYQLGSAYQYGNLSPVKRDYTKAVEWYTKALENGIDDKRKGIIYGELYKLYKGGGHGLEKNKEKADEYKKLAGL